MNYHILDSALTRWTDKHGLRIQTSYKDEAVRSIDVVSPSAERFQIWVDPPSNDGRTTVHAWDYRRRRVSFAVDDLARLEGGLEKAYSQIKNWY